MASPSPLPAADAPMGESVLSRDWGATPLGPMRSWPPSLVFAVGLCLRSPLAAALCWGPKRILVHNHAWARLVGGGTALGRPAPQVDHSLWRVAAPLVELNHRVKNTLASVQGIAFQTLRGEVSLAEARARFEARLMALSGAHNRAAERALD